MLQAWRVASHILFLELPYYDQSGAKASNVMGYRSFIHMFLVILESNHPRSNELQNFVTVQLINAMIKLEIS